MSLRVAIPEPTSFDPAYNQRALPAYIAALHSAGLTAIPIPLHESQARVARLLSSVQGILLPGSRADVDPEKYGAPRSPQCGPADPARTAVDELLLQEAFNLHKPILAICQGLQALNVWLGGTLIQDLPTSRDLPTSQALPMSAAAGQRPVNHAPGREIVHAHTIQIHPNSRLAALQAHAPGDDGPLVHVNSSHHQAIATLGDRLLVSAISPDDGVIEAVELASPAHWVVAVQWHPERTLVESSLSRALFAGFAHAVEGWSPRAIKESVESVVSASVAPAPAGSVSVA